MTTLVYLQMEAMARGISVDTLMQRYRGTHGPIGEMVQALDVQWLQDFAEQLMEPEDTEIWH